MASVSITMNGFSRRRLVLPGFGLTVGFTLLYLSLLVVIPLSTLFFKTATLTWAKFWTDITAPQVVAAFRLTFGASLAAAMVNVVFGVLVAWVLTRYTFPMRRIFDGLVDLPFALPTAVAGITLTALYDRNGWIGQYLESKLHIQVDYTPLGVVVALVFIGLPFVVRTVQPVMQDLDAQVEDAAASLGANRLQTFVKVISPTIAPAILTGFTLAFARALGEYGSVVFISANIPFKTQILPQLIMIKLDEFDIAGATAIAAVMLVASFALLLLINLIQLRTARKFGAV
jgi:sulfate/thiosulfate transport system permease protein